MRQPLLLISLSLGVFLSANVLAQDLVQIQFQTDPVLVQTSTEVVFTVLTVPNVLSMTWQYKGETLGLWAGGAPVVNPVPQFLGRVTISATQLRIAGAQLRDAGNYTVEVTPSATTGLAPNSRSIQLRVFDAVTGVTMFVPTVAVEGRNVSLRCTWTTGTEITVQWGKGGAAVTADPRITIAGGSLVINPARRGDAGDYTCTVSNPVSAQTASRSLTVYYGPDAPVLTKDTPKECVGGGDVLVGQTVRLTCMSDSLPPALFSWQRDGQPVASGQPDSGVLSLQTFSTNESGRYVCTATNAITGGTSEQGTVLAIVDTCLDGGEVAGIVIGCLLLILIIALLIWLIVFLVRRRREERRRDTMLVPNTNPNPGPIPPDPQPNGARDLGQGPDPPLYHTHARLNAAPRVNRGDSQTLQQNGVQNSHTHWHNAHTHTNGLLHNSIHNANSFPHNGVDNPAFAHADAQTVDARPVSRQQNPNILIQAGSTPAVHVSLNALPHGAQHNNNNAQMPTIHVNLNSYSTNGQQTQQDGSFPLPNAAPNNATQAQLNMHADQSPSRRSHHSDHQLNGHTEGGRQRMPDLVPTGYTHSNNNNNTFQRNADTQTYQQEPEPQRRSAERISSSSGLQMPWDRLRGTPAYPSGTLERRRTPPRFDSDSTDYTSHPPVREERTPNRSQSRPQSQTATRSRAPPRHEAPSLDRQTQTHPANLRVPDARSVTQLEAAHHTQRSPRTQRESAHRDIRASPGSQTAPGHEATHSNNPQARPLMSQPASEGRAAVPHGPLTQEGRPALQGPDTRALADPNHLPQAHMARQHRAEPVQKPPQGLGTHTQPVRADASQPRQGGTAPVPHAPNQPAPSTLTQAALRAHTEKAQTFQNRKQQTRAALLHPGPPAPAPAAGTQRPPTPPPVIPLQQFQTLPKTHTQHRSPARGPQPPKPPVNMPVAQRHQQVPLHHHHDQQHHHHHHQQHPAAAAPAHRHHHAGHVHVHVSPHRHAHNHGNPAHFSHPPQQQTHRGRPR